ncbi:MAG TPA: hypothetical protein VHF05_01295, partial [Candidatus Paceibacterota bacterium]|nr:hypothetical protein [Candidatus Paceibacterota bacterium]
MALLQLIRHTVHGKYGAEDFMIQNDPSSVIRITFNRDEECISRIDAIFGYVGHGAKTAYEITCIGGSRTASFRLKEFPGLRFHVYPAIRQPAVHEMRILPKQETDSDTLLKGAYMVQTSAI